MTDQPSEQRPAKTPVIVRTGRSHYRTTIEAGPHALLVDEPAAYGGTDTGPTPYDLIAAALGACTSVTLRMYADRKDWPLEEIAVRITHSKVHAVDEEQCETSATARLDLLEREIDLVGALSDEQRARLLEIADRCPVHRTLSAGVHVKTRLAPPPRPA